MGLAVAVAQWRKGRRRGSQRIGGGAAAAAVAKSAGEAVRLEHREARLLEPVEQVDERLAIEDALERQPLGEGEGQS